jgi:hypothetical protein
MTLAVTLARAAGLAWDNANVHWIVGQLKNTTTNFVVNSLPVFGESLPNSHPVSNWLAVIYTLADRMPTGVVPLSQLAEAARAVYGVCWMGQQLLDQSLISSSQAADLLAAYNATFGAP